MYKPGKVITSVAKKGEKNITFVTIISANAFKSNKFFPFKKSKKKKKKLVKLVIQKLILLKTCVIILWNIDNYQWMLHVKVNAITFWDLTTWNVLFPCILTYMWNSGTYLHRKCHFWNSTLQILEQSCDTYFFTFSK